jgi:hypothetical protein
MSRIPRKKPVSLTKVPRWLRPKLSKALQLETGMCHIVNHDAVARGNCTDTVILYDYVHTVMAWSRVAELIGQGIEEMVVQLELAKRVEDHHNATGYITYTTPTDMDLGAIGVEVMDALAEQVDEQTFTDAVVWADRQMQSRLHWRTPLKDAA